MNTEGCLFAGFHPLGENATRRPVPRSPRHAALPILAGMGLLRLRALPDTAITALADVFNRRF